MSDTDNNTHQKNSNLERELVLSKKQRKLRLEWDNIEDKSWVSEHTICLMHRIVHIKVNLNTEIFYDITRIDSATEASKLKNVDEVISTV